MRELFEFRVPEEAAHEALGDGVGLKLGPVRKLVVAVADPLFAEIGRLQTAARKEGGFFFTSWDVRRRYSTAELSRARLLFVRPKRTFEPAGEESGTKYDDALACASCGAGASHVGPLVLPLSKLASRSNFSRTIAGEVVVSSRVRDAYGAAGLRGASFGPILSPRSRQPSADYFQLIVNGSRAELAGSTRTGIDPFDDDPLGRFRCPDGHVAGLNVLGDVRVDSQSVSEGDFLETTQMVGRRSGLLRPKPLLLLSSRAWQALTEAKLQGLYVEVAQLVLVSEAGLPGLRPASSIE